MKVVVRHGLGMKASIDKVRVVPFLFMEDKENLIRRKEKRILG